MIVVVTAAVRTRRDPSNLVHEKQHGNHTTYPEGRRLDPERETVPDQLRPRHEARARAGPPIRKQENFYRRRPSAASRTFRREAFPFYNGSRS